MKIEKHFQVTCSEWNEELPNIKRWNDEDFIEYKDEIINKVELESMGEVHIIEDK